MVIAWCGSVHGVEAELQVRATLTDAAPETCPRSATISSTLSYAKCDAHHSNHPVYVDPRHFCSMRDAGRISVPSPPLAASATPVGARRDDVRNLDPARRPGRRRYSALVETVGRRPGAAPSEDLRGPRAGRRGSVTDRDGTGTAAISRVRLSGGGDDPRAPRGFTSSSCA